MKQEIEKIRKKGELVQILIDISEATPKHTFFSRKRYLSYMKLEGFIQRIDNYIDKYYIRSNNGNQDMEV